MDIGSLGIVEENPINFGIKHQFGGFDLMLLAILIGILQLCKFLAFGNSAILIELVIVHNLLILHGADINNIAPIETTQLDPVLACCVVLEGHFYD